MKKSFLLVALIAISAIIPTACNCKQQANGSNLSTDSLKYEKKTKTAECIIKADYPKDGNPALANAIEEYISESLGGTYYGNLSNGDSLLAFYGDAQMKDLESTAKELVGSATPSVYNSNIIKKAYEADGYVTYTATNENFLGGAHGMHSQQGVTFRKSDGRRFGQEMLIGTDNDKFHKIIKEGLAEYFTKGGEKATTDEELKSLLITDNDINYLPLPQFAPYLTAEGVTFVYQPYEIAPYAAGMPQFTVSYDKMKPYLTSTIQKIIAKK